MVDIYGTNRSETIDEAPQPGAMSGSNRIFALGGDDLILGLRKQSGTTNDKVDGGNGIDTYRFAAGNVWSITNARFAENSGGNTWAVDFTKVEQFEVTALGHGTANLGAGDDVIDARQAGTDRTGNYTMGAGDDIVMASRGTVTAALGDGGGDRLVIDHSFNNARTILSVPLSGDLATGYSGTFYRSDGAAVYARIAFTGVEHFTIITTGGSNTFASDTIVTGDGDDIVSTGAADDLITVARGNDVVDGGAETDALSIDLSDETAGVRIDLLATGAQQTGGSGAITGVESFQGAVSGSAFDDVLSEGNFAFNAQFATGQGDDLVQVSRGTDGVDLGQGSDRLVLEHSYNIARTSLTGTLSGSLATGYSGTYNRSDSAARYATVSFSGVEHFTINTTGGSNTGASDAIVTGDGDDIVSTGAADDLITVARGNDVIDGGAEIDALSIDLSDETAGVRIDLLATGAQQTGGSGAIAGVESFQGAVTGSRFADTFIEGVYAYDAQFSTGAGNDNVQVSRGTDGVAMGAGSDRLILDHRYNNAFTYTDVALTGDLASGYSGAFRRSDGASTSAVVSFSGVENFTILTGGGGDTLTTGGGSDVLDGGAGNDVLDGGGGADRLTGGSGDDLFYVDDAGDRIGELAAEGTDTVRSTIDFTLGNAIENLVLTGTAAIDGTGNGLANILTGNDAANVLNGGADADRMVGGLGDDTFVVNDAGDVVVETGVGTDIVRSGIDYVLGASVENLTLTGAARSGTGNELANRIEGSIGGDTLAGLDGADVLLGGDGRDTLGGGTGADVLSGGADRDILTGGSGADIFRFATGDTGATAGNADTIADFARAEADRINLVGVDAIAGTPANDRFAFVGTAAFSGTAGELRYAFSGADTLLLGDTDGNGNADVFIRLTGHVALTAADLVLGGGGGGLLVQPDAAFGWG